VNDSTKKATAAPPTTEAPSAVNEIIAERLDSGTGEVVVARTLRGHSAEALLVGNDIAIGVINVMTEEAMVTLRVSADPKDFQQARVYEDNKLVQSLLFKDGSVVYVDEAAVAAVNAVSPQPDGK
jgi:hypothetical protein